MSFTNLNEKFHIFSKSPVRSGQLLGSARNKSGHTVTSSDIWSEDIPAMFYAYTTEQRISFANIASDNDLCYDKTLNTLYYYKDKTWHDRTSLKDQEVLFNSAAASLGIYNDGTSYTNNSDKGVVKYHSNKEANSITGDNNNQSAGNGYTGRIKSSEGNYFISQFVSSMDKVVQGNPSSLYDPVVIYNGQTLEESTEDTTERKYIANSYAGIIQFHTPFSVNSSGNFSNVSVSVFEYIGKKLTDVLIDLGNDDTSAFNYTVAESLPTPDSTLKGWIYFVPANDTKDKNIYNEYICVENSDSETGWEWEQIGSTAITLPGTGDFIGIDGNNNIYVKTSSEIENNSETVPTTQAVYEHSSNTEIHLLNDISEANISDGQTAVGETIYGFVLSPSYNVRITKIRIVQTNFQGASWNKKFYLKIVDPETNREHISTSKIIHNLYGLQFPITDFMFSEFETPYLINGREYKVTFHDDTTHAPVGLSVAYVEDRKINELNKHISVTTKKIDANGNISSIVEGTVNGGQYGINSFTKIGYAAYPSTKTSTNNHLFNHFIDVNNEIIDKLGNTTDNTALQAGAFIGIDQDNAIYVKTSSEIENNPETVPTSQQLYSHHIDNERHITKEERERWNNNVAVQTGINIGTEDNLITPTATIANEGFLQGVTAINFRGAFVNVVKDNDKIITVWINKDNNYPEVSTASSSGVTTSAKYVFGSSTNTWQLPVANGGSFNSCHPITNDQTIKLKGYKEGIEQESVSIKNLTSKIRVVILDKSGGKIREFTTPFINENIQSEVKDGDSGITVKFTYLKQYTDDDASDGYIPNTVGIKCQIKLDTSVIISDGGVYEARVYLDKYDDENSSTASESTTLHDGEIYYAYKTMAATITGGTGGTEGKPSVDFQTVNGEKQIETRWVSGVQYIAKDTKFKVTHQQMNNTTYMVADDAVIRGSVSLSNCTCDDGADITGSTDAKENTTIPSGTKTFTLSSNNSVMSSLTATHTAYSVGGNATKTKAYTPTINDKNMQIWSTGREDTYNTAYFEKEQTDDEGVNKDYGRILGYIDGNGKLVIVSNTFKSDELLSGNTNNDVYNKQAKVYDGKLLYGEGEGEEPKFYVRKFKKNNTANASQLKGFNITVPGLEMDSDKMEVWYFLADTNGLGLSKGQKISASKPDGIGELNKDDSNKVYAALNANALPSIPNDNENFYIVIVLKDKNTSITGDVTIS